MRRVWLLVLIFGVTVGLGASSNLNLKRVPSRADMGVKKGRHTSVRPKIHVPVVKQYHKASPSGVKQQSLLFEGFEGGVIPPSGWSQYMVSDSNSPGWQITTDAYEGTYAAYHNDDHASTDSLSDWLVTPQLSIPAGEPVWLVFKQKVRFSDWYWYHGVWISTGSGDPNDGDFVELAELSSNLSTDWNEIRIDLSAYAGQDIYLAFVYVGDFSDEWYIDNVEVIYGEMSADVLVVDDGGGSGLYFTYALYSLGYTFDYFNCADSGRAPTLEEMERYQALVWTTDGEYIPSNVYIDDASDDIEAYLNNGGKLWVSSQDLLYYIFPTPPAWMHIQSYTKDVDVDDFTAHGVPGSAIGDGLEFDVFDDWAFGNWADEIVPTADANAEFEDDDGHTIAISYSDGYKFFFSAFAYENIRHQSDAEALMQRVMDFFGVQPNPAAYNVGIEQLDVHPRISVLSKDVVFADVVVRNYTAYPTYTPVVIRVYFQDGRVAFEDEKIVDVPAFGTGDVTFTWTPRIQDYYDVEVFTAMPADSDPITDTARSNVLVADKILDFEDTDGSFNPDPLTDGWEWGTPSGDDPTPFSGEKLWGTALGEWYENNADWTLERAFVATSDSPVVAFMHWYEIEEEWDVGYVEISTDGGNTWDIIQPVGGYPYDFTNFGVPGYGGTSDGWEFAAFLLSDYVNDGDTFRLRFHLRSDYYFRMQGWYIDYFAYAYMDTLMSYDFGVVGLTADEVYVGEPMTITATVQRFDNPASDVPVVYEIYLDEDLMATLHDTVDLSVDDIAYSTVEYVPPVGAEDYTIIAYTDYPLELNPINDAETLVVHVTAYDFGVVDVEADSVLLDSAMEITTRVHRWADGCSEVPVYFDIYNQDSGGLHVAHLVDTIDMSVYNERSLTIEYVPTRPGEYLIVAYTDFPRDTCNANDTSSTTTYVTGYDFAVVEVTADTIIYPFDSLTVVAKVMSYNDGYDQVPVYYDFYLVQGKTEQFKGRVISTVDLSTVDSVYDTIKFKPPDAGDYHIYAYIYFDLDFNSSNDTADAFVHVFAFDFYVDKIYVDEAFVYDTMPVTAWIVRLGDTCSNLEVVFEYWDPNGVLEEADTVFVDLSGADNTTTATADFVPDLSGHYTVTVYTVHLFDTLAANDAKSYDVNVAPTIDYTGYGTGFEVDADFDDWVRLGTGEWSIERDTFPHRDLYAARFVTDGGMAYLMSRYDLRVYGSPVFSFYWRVAGSSCEDMMVVSLSFDRVTWVDVDAICGDTGYAWVQFRALDYLTPGVDDSLLYVRIALYTNSGAYGLVDDFNATEGNGDVGIVDQIDEVFKGDTSIFNGDTLVASLFNPYVRVRNFGGVGGPGG